MPSDLPFYEARVGKYHLLFLEAAPGSYRLYVGTDRKRYCHYDTGEFRNLRDAVDSGLRGFDPTPYEIFPVTPFSRDEILATAPHAFDRLRGDM